jgi:hypothetical protein
MSLVHIYWINGKQRRIVAHHFKTSAQWLAAAALPKPKTKHRYKRLTTAGSVPSAHLSPTEFAARRQLLHAQLRERKNLRPIT